MLKLVVGIDFYQCAGDSQTQSLGLTFVAATVEIDTDVILLVDVESRKRLTHDVLKDGRGEIYIKRTMVDDDLSVAFPLR